MRLSRILGILTLGALLWSAQPGSAETPKVSRSVDSSGVPVISIQGKSPAKTTASPTAVAPKKDFKVYELDGPGAPTVTPSQAPQIVVISSPPPIPANPAAFNYGYYGGYGFGYPGYGGFGYPGYGVGYRGYAGYSGVRPVAPLNYQNPPVNYQNPPVNYRPAVPQGTYRCR